MQGKTKTTFINQSELEQRLNNQIKPTSFRLISGLEYTPGENELRNFSY